MNQAREWPEHVHPSCVMRIEVDVAARFLPSVDAAERWRERNLGERVSFFTERDTLAGGTITRIVLATDDNPQ